MTMDALFAIVLSLLAIFLILLVLVQRGRGGGLAGALGGMGGSSAFGAKAGDVFTRITIVTASIWIALCLGAWFWAKHGGDALSTASPTAPPASSVPLEAPLQGQSGSPRTNVPPPAESPANGAGAATSPAASGGSESPTPPAENP